MAGYLNNTSVRRPERIRDTLNESRLLKNRSLIAGIFVCILFLVLVARMWQLQVTEHNKYTTRSDDNRIRLKPVPPIRGKIYDRRGRTLAHNVPSYRLEIVPELAGDVLATIQSLQEYIQIDVDDVKRTVGLYRKQRNFLPIVLKKNLSDVEVAKFSVNQHRFPGVDVRTHLVRKYPYGELTAHLVGYLGQINRAEQNRIDPIQYRATSQIGKTGVEKVYEKRLHGSIGYTHQEVNAQGRPLRELDRQPPITGDDLFLYLDIQMQTIIREAFTGRRGAAVVVDVNTGGVLAMLSSPSFDPNQLVDGSNRRAIRAIMRSKKSPLLNRAISGHYPPGSTIKPFLALGALELGIRQMNSKTYCKGWYQLPGQKYHFRDWKRWGHGRVGINDAIIESCDVFFYELAVDIGIDNIHDYLGEFGFGTVSGIDIPGESKGLNPSPEWKMKTRQQSWYAGETLNVSIGQGDLLATPLQLAVATMNFVNAGTKIPPKIVWAYKHENSKKLARIGKSEKAKKLKKIKVINHKHWNLVRDAMYKVVHGHKGTAKGISNGMAYSMGGKTGTSQVINFDKSIDERKEHELEKFKDHGLFIAFAPAESPAITLSIIVENGGSGSSSAAPIARKIVDYYMKEYQPQMKNDEEMRLSYQHHPHEHRNDNHL